MPEIFPAGDAARLVTRPRSLACAHGKTQTGHFVLSAHASLACAHGKTWVSVSLTDADGFLGEMPEIFPATGSGRFSRLKSER